MSDYGWVASTSVRTVRQVSASAVSGGGPPQDPDTLRPELADVGRLVRRGVRGVVGAARAGQQVGLASVLRGHLGRSGADLDVIGESWPGYQHVNVQAGLDAWVGASGARSSSSGWSASSTARSVSPICSAPTIRTATPPASAPAASPG